MASNLFTSLFNALSDPKSYYALQKEMNLRAVAQTFFNSLAGKTTFDAVVLPEDIGSVKTFDGTRAVRVRPIGIYDMIIPEPCIFKDPATIKRILALHPIAYPDSDSSSNGGGLQTPESPPFSARVVECFYRTGPQENGKLRGLTYRTKKTTSGGRGINLSCLESEMEAMGEGAAAFDAGGHSPLVLAAGGKISNGKNIAGGLNINWKLLKKIGQANLLGPVLQDIASHESPLGGYDAYNRGSCDECAPLASGQFEEIFGNKLSELTIEQVIEQVQKGGRLKGRSAFAVGKYQMIPPTLREAVKTIEGLDTSEVFGKEQQEGLAAYLVLMKQPILGKYLLGSKTITPAAAQTAMATEWAGIRLVESANRPRKKNKKGEVVWEQRSLKPGESYYSGVGRNPFDVRITSAKATSAAIEKTRISIDKSPEFQEIINQILGKESSPHIFGVDSTDDPPHGFGGDTYQGPLK